ncbi:MAG: threonine ammonia-lyase [Chloroflexota bacterium]
MSTALTIADVIQARERLSAYLQPTPLEAAPDLGPAVWLKLENINRTHSFKIRGALNAVLSLNTAARERGIVTASSGNHAQGLAYAAQMVGAPATILMPAHTPRRKVEGVRRSGARAVLEFPNYDACEAEALRLALARDEGMTYVSPYNHPAIVAGAGTIGLEILDQLPDVKRVIVCVGGGGLISGIALAIRSFRPDAEVIGVNARAAPAMHNAFYGTTYPENWDTLAEALSGDIEAGSITVPLTRQYVDRIVLVEETHIAAAMRWLIDVQGWLVEGGGAVGVAALLAGVIPVDDTPTAVIVSGGNVDGDTVRRILQTD